MPEDEIVVYNRGEIQKKLNPAILQFVMLDDIQVAINKVSRHLEKAEFQGKEDPRTLTVTDEIQEVAPGYDWPLPPWISAYFINDGPDTARLSVNHPHDWIELRLNETITIDHAHADERIRIIYYVCDPAETASVRVIGVY